MHWALVNPARFLREQGQVTGLCDELSGLVAVWRVRPDDTVEVEFDLQIGEKRYEGRLTYPDVFPNSPPIIRPRDGASRWSSHQFGDGGPLCLQWRTDNWHSDVTGADMLRSAHELLSTEQGAGAPPAAVPNAHQITKGQKLRGETVRFVLTANLYLAFQHVPQGGSASLKTRTVFSLPTEVCFVSEVEGEANDVKVAGLPAGVHSFSPLRCYSGTGRIFRSDRFDDLPVPSTFEGLRDVLTSAGFDAGIVMPTETEPDKASIDRVILLGSQSVNVFGLEDGNPIKLVSNAVVFDQGFGRSGPEAGALSGLGVAVVGLGSMGSKVAVSLARSGVRRFLLVDDDFLLPGNVERNELTWAGVGLHKAHAVRDQINLIASDVDVSVRLHRIAGQESSLDGASLMRRLSECSLIIDATANPEVFVRLAAIAQQAQVPIVWGEVFATAYGGFIARARPDLDPNPLAVRDSLHRYLADQPTAPFQHAQGYDGSDDEILTAFDSDVGFISAALTRLAIDTLLRRSPSHYPTPLYLIGMRQEWIFSEPFHIQPIAANGPGWEGNVEPTNPEVMMQTLRALQKMMAEPPNADSTATSIGD
jgi:hypothetical protein